MPRDLHQKAKKKSHGDQSGENHSETLRVERANSLSGSGTIIYVVSCREKEICRMKMRGRECTKSKDVF